VKLRSVRESDLRRLLGHGATDFRDPVTNADNGGLAESVQEATAIGSDDPAAFAANGDGKSLFEIAGEEPAIRRHEMPGEGL
jgi:hypothetical protein